MELEGGRVSRLQLGDARFPTALRGYDIEMVHALINRAIVTIEQLELRADPPTGRTITPHELRDIDIPEVFRGYRRDEVNHLLERAARTIEWLEERGAAPPHDSEPHPPAEPEPWVPYFVERAPNSDEAPMAGAGPEPEATSEIAAAHERDAPAAAVEAFDRVDVDLGDRGYPVVIGSGAINELGALLAERGIGRVAIVTQAEVKTHVDLVQRALDGVGVVHETFLMRDGEQFKTMATVEELCRDFAQWGLLRGDAVVALGGGIVGDTAGFAAAVYHRGVAVVQVPTTLLAMVDSSIGGKTGVNLPQGKNLVGAFHQPLAVLADPTVLSTLPDREYRCGLGEVAKYALMGETELANLVAANPGGLIARDPGVLRRVIMKSALAKARFVSADEFEESGLRAQLNYGHTFAHALETVADHSFAHGEAVAVGLVFAGALAGALERIPAAAADRHLGIVRSLGLPTRVPAGIRRDALLDVMRRDKKARGGLTFVLAGPTGLERVDDPDERALQAAFAAVGVPD